MSSASRAEDWIVRPRDLKMRVVRLRAEAAEFMVLYFGWFAVFFVLCLSAKFSLLSGGRNGASLSPTHKLQKIILGGKQQRFRL